MIIDINNPSEKRVPFHILFYLFSVVHTSSALIYAHVIALTNVEPFKLTIKIFDPAFKNRSWIIQSRVLLVVVLLTR